MTTTKRVPSGAAGGSTKRIETAALESTTKRIVGTAAVGSTKRVDAVALEDITVRVSGTITLSETERVPGEVIDTSGPFLLLEGGVNDGGFLELEAEGLTGFLKLQGTY